MILAVALAFQFTTSLRFPKNIRKLSHAFKECYMKRGVKTEKEGEKQQSSLTIIPKKDTAVPRIADSYVD